MIRFIGSNIEHLRKKQKWTQEQLGEKIGIKKGTISAYEKGKALPPLDKCKILAELFDVNLDDLVNKDLTQSDNTEYEQLSAEFERRLAALERKINTTPTPEDLATLDELVRVLKDKYPEVAGELGL